MHVNFNVFFLSFLVAFLLLLIRLLRGVPPSPYPRTPEKMKRPTARPVRSRPHAFFLYR